jgi:hypothetical protein
MLDTVTLDTDVRIRATFLGAGLFRDLSLEIHSSGKKNNEAY